MSWTSNFISPSRIDNYVKYLSGYLWKFGDNFEEYTPELFVDKLLAIEAVSLKAEAGTAVHKWLENVTYGDISTSSVINSQGWKIQVASDLDIKLLLPICREVPVSGRIGEHAIKGTVDSMDAVYVRDYKTTSNYNADTYINSWQWRTYLYLTGLTKFIYDIFSVDINEAEKIITLKEYHKICLSAYPKMRNEVENIVDDYHNLLLKFEDRIIDRANKYNACLNLQCKELIAQAECIPTIATILLDTVTKIKDKLIIIDDLEGVN